MAKLFKLLFLFVLVTCAFSCKKETPAPSKTELLTKSPWKGTNSETGTGGSWTSDWSSIDDCDKDDITVFKTDKTYTVTEGASKCDPSDPDEVDSSTWQFSSDESSLIIDVISYQIVTLNESTLQLKVSFGGTDYRFTYGH